MQAEYAFKQLGSEQEIKLLNKRGLKGCGNQKSFEGDKHKRDAISSPDTNRKFRRYEHSGQFEY